MYRFAVRANSGLLKRINKHAPCVYKVVVARREPLTSKGVNAAHRTFGLKGPGFSTGHSSKRVDTPSLLVQWQRKWLVRSSFAVNNAPGTRLARMFSDNTNNKEKIGKQENSSMKPSQKQNAKETGRTSKKPSNKGFSEGHVSAKSTESCEGDSAHEHPVVKRTVLDKRKRELSKSTANKCRIKKIERTKTSTETSSTKNIEEFDRLQLIKGKMIRKLGKKWTPWENIRETLDNFPYYLNENTRHLLLDCVAARVKKHEFSAFGESLPCTSHLILLQGRPGTELYQEALVRAIAHELQVPLLVVDNNTLSAKDLKDDANIAGFPVEGNKLKKAEKALHAENKPNGQPFSLASVNQMLGSQVKILDLKNPKKKFDIPWKVLRFSTKEDLQDMSKPIQANNENWENELKNLLVTGREDQLKKLGKKGEELKKFWHDLIIGDHVRYKGLKGTQGKTREKARIGQEGFVSSISDSLPWKVCVKFQGGAEEVFCDAAELEKVNSNASDEAWLARFPELPIEALCKMVVYCGPVIVHFPDMQDWFSSVPSNGQVSFFKKVKELLTKVDGPVVFIASSSKEETSVQLAATTDLDSILSSFIIETQSKSSHTKEDNILNETVKIFKNVIRILPPEEPHLLRVWLNKLDEDRKQVKRTRSLTLLQESLEKNCMKCAEIRGVNTSDLQLTSESADDVVGWARNMIYHRKQLQTSEGRLMIEKRCLERSLERLKDLKFANEEKISHIAALAENEYEKSLVSSVVSANDIGVRFDEVGALEDVKTTLKELIVLPMKRPELFRKGNLRKPCKGVLLFGPPGTGKTLVAKAVATEAGANFISITASSLTSKFYGDDEKLVKAMFALARKLSPAVIFLDEVDSLLGARGGSSEHEATRRIKNEIMAAWDGLQTKESEQILVFATTNRPFDLDDAVIRRLPRRILVDLPNAENRAKILRVILANEDLDSTFSFESLALETDGYSGSDLKNLCVTAAYIPIRELLEAEQQTSDVSGFGQPQSVRPLCMNDFLQAKAKIGASLAYDAAAMVQIRQWNEQYGEGGSRYQKRIGFSQ